MATHVIPGFSGEMFAPGTAEYDEKRVQYASSSYPERQGLGGSMRPYLIAYPRMDSDDIPAAIRFAKANNKRLVARSGGHHTAAYPPVAMTPSSSAWTTTIIGSSKRSATRRSHGRRRHAAHGPRRRTPEERRYDSAWRVSPRRIALMEVAELARLGRLKVLVDRYPLSAAKQAYDDFEHGRLVGRAVLMPASAADEGRAAKSSRVPQAKTGA